jgi:beta-phosphoglucomutase family hydrolase
MTSIPVFSETKGLIFDIDGTLVDTLPAHYKACQIICNEFGFDFPLDFFYQYSGVPTIKTFEILKAKLNLNFNAEKLGRLKDEKYLEILHEVKPVPEVYNIVLNYKGKLPMSLGTGASRKIAERNLHAAGLSDLFDIVITADDVKKHKPSPETFLLCAERMGVAPQYCQVFEDADPGLAAAKEGGMMFTDIRKYVKLNALG